MGLFLFCTWVKHGKHELSYSHVRNNSTLSTVIDGKMRLLHSAQSHTKTKVTCFLVNSDLRLFVYVYSGVGPSLSCLTCYTLPTRWKSRPDITPLKTKKETKTGWGVSVLMFETQVLFERFQHPQCCILCIN